MKESEDLAKTWEKTKKSNDKFFMKRSRLEGMNSRRHSFRKVVPEGKCIRSSNCIYNARILVSPLGFNNACILIPKVLTR